MKTKNILWLLGIALLFAGRASAALIPFGTEFTYQGRLADGPAGASGRYDFRFALYDAAGGGTPIVTVSNLNVTVTNGVFTTDVNFGANIFIGYALWIEIGVRSNGTANAFTPLSPRQPLTPTPNAHFAALAGTVPNGSINAAKLGDDSVDAAALQNNSVLGAKIANGQVVRALNGLRDNVSLAAGINTTLTTNGNTLTLGGSPDWTLSGNAGTTPAANFLGTTDNQPLTIKVGGAIALRIEPNVSVPNIVGGLSAFRPTVIGPNVAGAVVAGGNAPAGPVTGIGAGDFHAVWDSDGVVGGGFGNKVGTDDGNPNNAPFATVAGGVFNGAANYASTVAGGDGNLASGIRATVGGGAGNLSVGEHAFVGGGIHNRALQRSSSVGGGQNNIATNAHAAVAGGGWNTASGASAFIGGGGGDTFGGPWPNTASGDWSAILGGWNNTASGYSSVVGGGGQSAASGRYAVVPGGEANTAAGDYSFAAGRGARALHFGAYVWADSQFGTFASTAANQFLIRAAGGVGIGTTSPSEQLHVAGNALISGNLRATGINLPNNFGPDPAFVGTTGNHIAFGHAGVSEDFIGYRDNTFFFKDSPGGGDVCPPVVEVSVLRITGGCDVAEPFQMSSTNIPGGAVVVIDDENPGRLKLSERAYDTRVAGIVSGANGVKAGITLYQEGLLEGGQNVALSGRVYAQADAAHGEIKPGDLLTTAHTPGYAMKVTDHGKAQGAILGKAMSALKDGKGMVLVLVTLQ